MLSLVISATLGAAGFSVPYLEQMVSLSVVLFGAMLVLSRQKMPAMVVGLGLVALAASCTAWRTASRHLRPDLPPMQQVSWPPPSSCILVAWRSVWAIRKALAEKATWVVTGLGTLCSGAGLYLFSQL
jgi:urease accessory protein